MHPKLKVVSKLFIQFAVADVSLLLFFLDSFVVVTVVAGVVVVGAADADAVVVTVILLVLLLLDCLQLCLPCCCCHCLCLKFTAGWKRSLKKEAPKKLFLSPK